jgi:hypothetical protein
MKWTRWTQGTSRLLVASFLNSSSNSTIITPPKSLVCLSIYPCLRSKSIWLMSISSFGTFLEQPNSFSSKLMILGSSIQHSTPKMIVATKINSSKTLISQLLSNLCSPNNPCRSLYLLWKQLISCLCSDQSDLYSTFLSSNTSLTPSRGNYLLEMLFTP